MEGHLSYSVYGTPPLWVLCPPALSAFCARSKPFYITASFSFASRVELQHSAHELTTCPRAASSLAVIPGTLSVARIRERFSLRFLPSFTVRSPPPPGCLLTCRHAPLESDAAGDGSGGRLQRARQVGHRSSRTNFLNCLPFPLDVSSAGAAIPSASAGSYFTAVNFGAGLPFFGLPLSPPIASVR